jgi:glutamate-ammonia-ligase adenylyltransferase
MTFAARLTRCPRAIDPARGDEALAAVPDLPQELKALLHGAAGSSPYLAGLIAREAAWLEGALAGTPEAALEDALALDEADLHNALRRAKRRVALLTALADLGGAWALEAVTGALTRLADLAVDRALAHCVGVEIRRGKVPGLARDADPQAAGIVALAMGKMGAGELNYSSDIDLICLFDESRHDPDSYFEVRKALVRATRNAMAMLSKADAEGYVFRTDLRLRPDPATTPVCLAMEAAERYYESVGRTWERAAYIKARAAAGDIAAGEAFLDSLRPFVWRKHLDFAAIQDAHDMRLRIRDHKGLHGGQALEGRNLKLAPGGIREIEFFTQTRQLIAGGRDPALRLRGTCEGLDALVAGGWVPGDAAETLKAAYRAHREVEHRLQMIHDAQTHDLPSSEEGFARLAALMGTESAALKRELQDRIGTVQAIAEAFFQPAPTPEAPREPELSAEGERIVANWRNYPALRSERAQVIFDRLRPALLRRLAETANMDRALTHLDGFLRGLPAGVQLFSLFEANPQLIDLVVDIADSAPDLALYLSRNAAVFDAVIGGSFFEAWPGRAALQADLAARLGRLDDYEARLDAARAWTKEQHFRIGVHHLRGLIDAEEAGREYAELAEAVLVALWPAVVAEFAAKHGPPPGRGAAVLGMGSLGAGRLNAHSDLDLIVIYDAAGVEASEGRRPLAARAYYARLTQALVTALSAPMAEGRLYEVDMRLRPSGRQGPVATALAAFQSYQREEAWTWEHLALTRARPVAGAEELREEIERFRRTLLAAPRDAGKAARDTAEMRDRLARAKPGAGGLDAKDGPGRLADIDLAAALMALLAGDPEQCPPDQIRAGRKAGLIEEEAAEALVAAQAALWRVQAAARLLSPGRLDPAALGPRGRALLLEGSGAETLDDLAQALDETASRAARIIETLVRKVAGT